MGHTIEKYLYVVRHGECEGNVDPALRGPDSPLTEKGIAQAKETARRLAHTPAEVILSSPMLRAQDTAHIIAQEIDKEVVTTESAHEIEFPAAFKHTSVFDEEFNRAFKRMFFEGDGEDVRDGEKFSEIVSRAESVLEYVLKRQERHVVLVSHGRFLRIIAGIVLFGNEFNSRNFYNLFQRTDIFNTGITLFRYFDKYHIGEGPQWRLCTWNDHAHLG